MVKNVLNIKVLREIKNNFKTYLSVIFIAVLAVTLFTGIWANYMNFNDRLNHIYEGANMCDGIVMTKTYNEDIENHLKYNNIFYEKRIYIPTTSNNNNIYLATFEETNTLNKPYQMSLTNLSNYDVLVDENFLNRNSCHIGDEIAVDLNFGMQKLSIKLKITGSMTHPESLENSTYNPAFIYTGYAALNEAIIKAFNNPFFSKEVVDKLLLDYYNQFIIKGDKEVFEQIKDEFSLSDNYVYSLKRDELPSNLTIDADVIQAKQLIYIFPVIFYFVAVLIILTSISQLINRDSKNIGIMKALGFSNIEILFHYMKIYILLGIIGSLVGIILGPIIVPTVMGKKYNILYQLPTISLPFFRIEFLFSVGILLLIIAATSIFACYSEMHKVPAASLRGDNAVNMYVSFLTKFKFFQKIPLAILMAFRNMKRKVSRTIMVLVGVLGCSALLVCGFGIEDTINHGFSLELEELIPYDVSTLYQTAGFKKEEITKITGVEEIDEYSKYTINIEKEHLVSSYLFILPEETKVAKLEYDQNSCLISSKVASDIGAKKGDTIDFVYNNKRYMVEITQVVDFCITQGIFVSCLHFEDIEYEPTAAWIKTTDQKYNQAVADELTKMAGVMSASSIEKVREHADETISSIKVMTLTIKIFAILLAVVVLYNLAYLNFKERIKDIATLKVLGFSKFEIASSLMIEIIFLTFIGALVGLLLGYPLLLAVLSINETPLLKYIYHIYPVSYFWTVLITCGSSLVINLIFAFLTNKVQMVESLKSVE